jgi:ribose transport system permease protein
VPDEVTAARDPVATPADERALHARGGALAGLTRITNRLPVEVGSLAGLAGIIAIFASLSPYFFTTSNMSLISEQAALFGVMAVGMAFVLISGEIDLSVGAIFGLASVSMALAIQHGVDPTLSVLVALGVGAGAGCLNGLLSALLRVPTIVITLGTLSIYRGLIYWLTDGFPIQELPTDSWVFSLGDGELWLIPYQVFVMLGVALAAALVLRKTRFGYHVFATGSNRRAAMFAAVRVARVKIAVLTGMGLLAGVAGVLGLVTTHTGDPNSGLGYELDVIAAAIIGGVKLTGGAGSVLGALIGTFIIAVIRNGLAVVGVPIFANQIATGVIVVSAVAIDLLVRERRTAR